MEGPKPNGLNTTLPGAFSGARHSLQRGPAGIQPTSFRVLVSPAIFPVRMPRHTSVISSSGSG